MVTALNHRQNGQALLELSLSLWLLFFWLLGITWVGNIALNQVRLESAQKQSFAAGLEKMPENKLKQLLNPLLANKEFYRQKSQKNKKQQSKNSMLPGFLQKIFSFMMNTKEEGLKLKIKNFSPHLKENKKREEIIYSSLTWDSNSYANSKKLAALLWSTSLLKASLSGNQLTKNLGKLRQVGSGYGAKDIAKSFPGVNGDN